jgi:hypothetical protein
MTHGALAAVGLAAAGLELFDYNRENFLYDSELRLDRLIVEREYACAQAEQYREDIRSLTHLTMKRNTMYAISGSAILAFLIVLHTEGRLGFHGPTPPGWFMGLYLTSVAISFGFLALSIWLSLHASFRAQAASAHLLTRRVRLPVPTLKQLAQSRKLASEFEQQNWSDIFRIPYLSNNGAPKTDILPGNISASRARSASPPSGRHSRRASSWIREEFETDRAGTVSMGQIPVDVVPHDAAPEHFKLYAEVQKEWFQYDIYNRVTLLLGFVSFVQAIGFYSVGHIIIELRAFWVAHATTFCLEVFHVLLLRFDIIAGRMKRKERLSHCQWLGPLSVFFTMIAMTVDFKVQFDMKGVTVTWIFVFLAYVSQFLYQLRLLELVIPDELKRSVRNKLDEEEIGNSWWPESLQVPSSWMHVLYFVAPPTHLRAGQNDLVREVKMGSTDPALAGVNPAYLSRKAEVNENLETYSDIYNKSSETSSNVSPGVAQTSEKELAEQVQYLDSLFAWMFNECVFETVSLSGKKRIKDLYKKHLEVRRKTSRAEASKIVQECLTGLGAIIIEEGLQSGDVASSGSDVEAATSNVFGLEESSPSHVRRGGTRFSELTDEPIYKRTQDMKPWRLVSMFQAMICLVWLFLTLTTIFDAVTGDQSLVTAPGELVPPMTMDARKPHEQATPLGGAAPAGTRPWLPEHMAWEEEQEKASGGERRLSRTATKDRPLASVTTAVSDERTSLLSSLDSFIAAFKRSAADYARPLKLSWPAFAEPRLLACGSTGLAALTPRGVGMQVLPSAIKSVDVTQPRTFKLGGLTHLPALISASWEEESDNLLVVTRSGDIAFCLAEKSSGAMWPCTPSRHRLPVDSQTTLLAAAVARSSSSLRAALIFDETPDVIALFALGADKDSTWLPLGELSLRQSGRSSLAFAQGGNELLVTNEHGSFVQYRLQDGAITAAAKDRWVSDSVSQWQAACSLPDEVEGGIAHLRLHRSEKSEAWRPEIVVDNLKEKQIQDAQTQATTLV